MVEAAVAGQAGLEVSRMELERPAPSFTADTLEALVAQRPNDLLWLILGADQLASLPRWSRPERILELARVAAVDRGAPVALPPSRAADRVDRIVMPRIDISSSEVRRRLDAGDPVDHLLPGGVASLIAEAA